MTPWDVGSHVCCMVGPSGGNTKCAPNVGKRNHIQDDPQPFLGIHIVYPSRNPSTFLQALDISISGASPLRLSKRARDHPAGRSLWKPIRLGAALVVGLTLLFALPAGAYQEIRVENGGNIAGRVIYDGPPRAAARLPVRKNRNFCGESAADERLIVGPNRGLRNVAVWLDGINAGKPPETAPAVLDNVACAFVPRVQVVTVGQMLRLRNSDAILHNVHARRNGFTTIFNMGLPHWSEKTHRFTQPGRVVVDCDVLHTWMRAYVIVTAHPYAVVTGSDGRFRLTHVPAGAYTIRFWHEHLGERTRRVTVHPDRKTRIRLRYAPHGPPPHSSHLRPKRVSRPLFWSFRLPHSPYPPSLLALPPLPFVIPAEAGIQRTEATTWGDVRRCGGSDLAGPSPEGRGDRKEG